MHSIPLRYDIFISLLYIWLARTAKYDEDDESSGNTSYISRIQPASEYSKSHGARILGGLDGLHSSPSISLLEGLPYDTMETYGYMADCSTSPAIFTSAVVESVR
jgi:hypothetical protein